MKAEAILYAILSGDAAISAIVGSRIHGGQSPQNAQTPYLVYHRATTQREQALNRWLRSPRVRLQIDCWGDKNQYSDLIDLSQAIRKAIETAPREVAGAIILGKNIENEQGPFEEEDGRYYHAIIEPMIRYREA